MRCRYAIAAVSGPGVGAGASAAGLSSVEIAPAVPEVQEPGTCSLLDADVAPHWPAKPGVYVRGAFTRQMGAQQLARMGGGARCGAKLLFQHVTLICLQAFRLHSSMTTGSCTLVWDMFATFMYQMMKSQLL